MDELVYATLDDLKIAKRNLQERIDSGETPRWWGELNMRWIDEDIKHADTSRFTAEEYGNGTGTSRHDEH